MRDDDQQVASTSMPTKEPKLECCDESEPAISEDLIFSCCLCEVHAKYEYFGRQPPHSPAIRFREDAYIMRDPFQPHTRTDSTSYLQLGANCHGCDRAVCCDTSCSIFYGVRLCRICAIQRLNQYPPEIQREVQKMQHQAGQAKVK